MCLLILQLLEGLQSSLIISKIPSVSHDKGYKSQNRSGSRGKMLILEFILDFSSLMLQQSQVLYGVSCVYATGMHKTDWLI